MNQQTIHKNYPLRIIAVTNLLSLLIYITGAYIIYQLSIIWALLYIGYILFLEIRLLSVSCPDCYYYSKLCPFGKGWVSALFFKKGIPENFACRKFSWADMIPDLLVVLFPLLVGIIVLIIKFSWFLLVAAGILMLLATIGNSFVRGQLACKYCKQGEIGCPALELFSKGKSF